MQFYMGQSIQGMRPTKKEKYVVNRFKNILVVVADKTDHNVILGRALTLGQRNQARLTVVNVVKDMLHIDQMPIAPESPADVQESDIKIIEELSRDTSLPIISAQLAEVQGPIRDAAELPRQPHISAPSKPAVSIQEYIIEEGHRDLKQSVAALRQAGVQVSSKVLSGTPFLEIIREVLRNKHDLVMIAAEGQSGLKKMLFGSTTMHLMRKCPCPVWVMKPSQPKQYSRILAAVDPTPLDEKRNALNMKIMDLATSLAQLEQSELHIVHAWALYREFGLTYGHIQIPKSELDKLIRETETMHGRWFSELLREYPLEKLNCQVHLLHGDAGTLIPEQAKEKEIELIVMGTVCRTGVVGLLIGNTAENVLRQVNCSVLTVKPDGFVTPVRLDN
ncbi:MAG: universal stress protein [Anaerolineae bacterium]|nr:universal stress protein [Anaerolineae bacterium]